MHAPATLYQVALSGIIQLISNMYVWIDIPTSGLNYHLRLIDFPILAYLSLSCHHGLIDFLIRVWLDNPIGNDHNECCMTYSCYISTGCCSSAVLSLELIKLSWYFICRNRNERIAKARINVPTLFPNNQAVCMIMILFRLFMRRHRL